MTSIPTVPAARTARRAGSACGAALVCLGLVSGALAATSPSQAPALDVGVPMTTALNSQGGAGWFRIAAPMLTADEVRLTVDSDGGRSGVEVRLCLAPATDDFGQADREAECGSPGYPGSLPHVDLGRGKYRRTLVWNRDRTDGFLIVRAGCGFCSADTDTITVGLEAQTHAVRVGTPTVDRSGAVFRFTSAVRLTDNTRAPDGLPGYVRLGFDGAAARRVAAGTVTGGRLRAIVRPPRAARRMTARVCTRAVTGFAEACSAVMTVRWSPR